MPPPARSTTDARSSGSVTSPAAPGVTLTPRELRAIQSEVARMIREATRGLELSLHVPGRHYSGLSYDELLEILADNGRDFAAPTSAMRRHIAAEVSLRFDGARRVPYATELRRAMADAALGWIVRRFAARVRDERLRALTIPYAKAKAKAGYGDRPIGTRTGALAARVEDVGRVTFPR